MTHTTAIIIGAGQCGLAMSHALSRRSVDHLVIDRGEIGESWRTQRWDSLRMLTPNWANGLDGAPYAGPAPDGFMTPPEFVAQLERYAETIGTKIRTQTAVQRVATQGDRFVVESDAGVFTARVVVVATGAAARPIVPAVAQHVPPEIVQITPDRYRRPSDLPPGGVLVVGASASGAQLARELRLDGRAVTLAAGNHVRLPRRYRGEDIEHWLHVTGVLDQLNDDIFDLARAKKLPSPQLMGDVDSIDLNALQALGISVVGRLAAIRDGRALLSGGLAHLAASADLKMHRLLDLADAWVAAQDLEFPAPDRPAPTVLPDPPVLSLPLDDGAITSILWATGFAPDFSFLDVPSFDARGRLAHEGGVCAVPGLYVLGLPFLRRRRSHHISGASSDAAELAAHLATHLQSRSAA
ncbi:FAD-dependent oxidoreductase [Roseobacter sp. A03A-229]